jgi:hypothetical protein
MQVLRGKVKLPSYSRAHIDDGAASGEDASVLAATLAR